MGVVSGVVMAFQFGTNWSVLSKMSGPIQGPLLSYETFTAFMLEATFFGILIFGRPRVPPWFYLFSTAMVALGTTLSAFWIMVNNSWMQVPTGYVLQNDQFVPDDWTQIIFNRVVWVRFPHMLLASYLTGAFCVAATGAWYLLRRTYRPEAHVMLRMGLALAAVLLPVQLFIGHLVGDYVHDYQPAKFAAIEARWHDEQPASEVLIAMPGFEHRIEQVRDIDSGAREHHRQHEPDVERGRPHQLRAAGPAAGADPVLRLPHHGRLRLRDAGAGLARNLARPQASARSEHRLLLWGTFLSFPLPWVAILTGWYTAEVGRQPWTVYGVLRTADAVTPFLTASAAMTSLILFVAVYAFIFSFGTYYIYRLLRAGPAGLGGSRSTFPCPIGRCRSPIRCPPHAAISGRENSHGDVLGCPSCHQHPDLSPPRRVRSWRRHAVRRGRRRVAAGCHAEHGRSGLGRQ